VLESSEDSAVGVHCFLLRSKALRALHSRQRSYADKTCKTVKTELWSQVGRSNGGRAKPPAVCTFRAVAVTESSKSTERSKAASEASVR